MNVITPKIGEFNVISAGANIADDVEIGNFCVIEEDVVIGPKTVLKSHVEIRSGTRIGSECYLDSGVKISGDAKIGDGVTLRYDAIIARGCDIGDGTYVSPQVMFQNLDHEKSPIGGAVVGRHCFIGTNATINAGIRIADETVIGSKSLVMRDIPQSGWIYLGMPAKKHQRRRPSNA